MSPTVHALRNQIRVAVGRYERDVSSAFTKEALAAVCEAVDADIETTPTPSKSEMRAAILVAIGESDEFDPDAHDSALRKAELQAVADALEAQS